MMSFVIKAILKLLALTLNRIQNKLGGNIKLNSKTLLTRRDDKILWKGSGKDFITTFSHDILACSSYIISPLLYPH